MESTSQLVAGDPTMMSSSEFKKPTPRTLRGHGPGRTTQTAWVRALATLDSCRFASSCGEDINVWNIGEAAVHDLERNFIGHRGGKNDKNWIVGLTSLESGNSLAACSGVAVNVLDVATGQCKMTLGGHSNFINDICSIDDKFFATGSDDKTVKIWSLADNCSKQTLEGHTDSVSSVTIVGNSMLASGSKDCTIKVWDLAGGMTKCVTTLKNETWVRKISYLGDGLLANCSEDQTVKIWSLQNGECVRILQGHDAGISSLCNVGNGMLASGGKDNAVILWSIADGRQLAVLKGHQNWVQAFTRLDVGLFVSGSDDKNICIWSVGQIA